ncbi:MAG: hypothetical protein HZB41_12925 [Ignavibacteriae bacterium]|nr:hypothetical protein [Ignavibacteriota bacterium]
MKTSYSIIIIIFLFLTISLNAQYRPIDTLTGKVVHYAGIYAGAASILEETLYGFNLSGEYEYRVVKSSFGFGFNIHLIFSDITEYGFGVPLYLHGISSMNLRLSLTPGVTITKRVIYSRFEPGTLPVESTQNTANLFLQAGVGW